MNAEIKKTHIEEFKDLLGARESESIKKLVKELHASDVGRIFKGLDEKEAMEFFKLLTNVVASEVLLDVDDHQRQKLLDTLKPERLIEVVDEMETDDAADIISELPAEDARQVLDGIDVKDSIDVQRLLVYPEDTAGGKMQAELVSIPGNVTAEHGIKEVREKSVDMENITNIFVVDALGKLIGVLPIARLIQGSPDVLISEIMDREPMHVTTEVDQEEVARLFERYDLLSLPVVDGKGVLVGRITVDDVVDVIEEEIYEDFFRMAGLNKEERITDTPLRSIRMRAPWLLVNLGTAFLAASVVKVFSGTIEKLVILAVLMPVVAGMGGNAGTQTITVLVRSLALGELEFKDAKRILLKEITIGFFNGLLIGLGAGIIAYILGAGPAVGLLIFLAMIGNLVIAGFSGACIPLLLKRLKVDPAISAGIFVTTCTDIGGFLSFLGLATIFIKMGFL